MRDVLRKDAVTFVSLARTPAKTAEDGNGGADGGPQNGNDGVGVRLINLVVEESRGEGKRQRMMRDMGIDELMESYFRDVEGSYPGVVSNVVRTVDKLDIRRDGDGGGGRCSCCGGFISTSSSLGEDQGGRNGIDTVAGICARCERDFA
ncbi:hypothetical protein BDZ85DRAFT_258022 [Elsinoe ampelina]|uniref:Uncharacterized protein n=1 Tax=Elsinoe ampelina TaxID=302913 RepID=A0A6A6GK31_9PEZI|nr:hypothetical protein BDZ85DRAFT_258022 [Elsinoe ampelina]